MKTTGMILTACLLFSVLALGQEMPKPGPEHKKLDMFAGSWTLDGDMKASSMGPGGKMTEIEKCAWMDVIVFICFKMKF